MQTKKCTKCGKVKPLDAFSVHSASKDGKQSRCRVCRNAAKCKWRAANREKLREYNRKYRIDNSEKCGESVRKWRVDNPKKAGEYSRKYRLAHPKRVRETGRKCRAAHLEERRKYEAERLKNNPQARLRGHIRSRLYQAVKNGQKVGSAVRDLDCSMSYLQAHLEALWKPGMTWENYGRHKGMRCWEIDHIIPLSSFDLTDREQFLAVVHFSNLQPLWSDENKRKGAKNGG
ncbi:hypothetical protein LCGC14_0920420 [marine sediment metagenome]|uniref:HNH nuclease domain-containing protein n=1 Tax=marine sediment metagenome TaxID=412755 RepID=A0A0F9PBM2_9ZZZZ